MASIVRLLAVALAWTGIASLLPALVSARWGEGLAPAFLATALGCIFLAGAMRFASAGLGGRLRRFQVFVALASLWLLIPLVAAPVIAYATDLPLGRAWFEALSAFTTTGFTVVERGPRSLFAWFALLQWCGGLLTIVCAIAVLAPASIGGLPHRAAHALDSVQAVETLAALREVAPLYAGATGIAFLAMLVSGHGPYVAFCIASAVTSAGAHLPPEAREAIQGGEATRWVLMPFLLWAATSVRWHKALVGRRIHAAPEQSESLLLLGYWVVAGTVLGVIIYRLPSVIPAGEAISSGLFAAASLIATSGIPPEPGTYEEIPRSLQLILALVGGGALSVAAGLKVFRVRALVLRAQGDLLRLLSPNLVQPTRTGEGGVGSAMRGIWVTLLAVVCALAVVLILMSTSMPSFEAALTGAVAALTNTGPLYDASGAGWPPIASLPPWSMLAAAFAMVAGRLETVGLFVLLHLAVWRK